MRRGPAAMIVAALVLVGCGPAEEDAAEPPERTAPAPTAPDDGSDDGSDEEDPGADGGDEDVATSTFADCEADTFTVGYPEGWHTNDPDGLLGPCEVFHPEPIDEPERPRDRDLHHAVSLYVDPVPFEDVRADDPLHETVEERETTVDGRPAVVREVEAVEDALLPEGERRYAYAIDLAGETLLAVTYTVGDTDYERDKRILDRMVTEELSIADGPPPVSGPPTTGVSERENDGWRHVVADLRLGAHGSFDRVTFEIAGDEGPGWRIAYVDDPRSQGSGHEVDIDGGAFLHVSLVGFAYPPDAPVEPRDGPDRVAVPGTDAVVEVVDDSIYEGHHDFYIGLDEERPYRVELLTDPSRLVIDIETG